MSSTFVGIETAFRALQAQQKALNITGHNIANANTEGYSRQTADIVASEPFTFPSLNRSGEAGQMGTGSEVATIQRMRDSFMDGQIRQENQSLGRWQARDQNLQQLQLIFNEPSDSGINTAMTNFWNALQELSKNPENMSNRSVLKEQGVVMTDTIKHIYGQVTQLQSDLNQQLDIKVDEVNSTAQQIADLNDQIGKVASLGDQPNDLLDQREVLVQKLAGLTNIELSTDSVNRYNITISGRTLISGSTVTNLYTEANPDHNGLYDVKWTDNNQNVQFRNGAISGILEVRDDEITSYQSNLNDLASSLITKMNEVHQAGYGLDGATGVPFFSGTDASDIEVSQQVQLDLRSIAASTNPQPGDGDNASAMAALMQKPIMNSGTATFATFYSSLIARLGVDAQKAQTTGDNQDLLVKHLQNSQDSVSGVSLDEEMANMVKFQNAYSAAARVMTTMDQMLDTLINKMAV